MQAALHILLDTVALDRPCDDAHFTYRRITMNRFFRRVFQAYLLIAIGALTAGTSFGQSSESISVGPGTLTYEVTESQTTCVPNPGQRGTVDKSLYNKFSFTDSSGTFSLGAIQGGTI